MPSLKSFLQRAISRAPAAPKQVIPESLALQRKAVELASQRRGAPLVETATRAVQKAQPPAAPASPAGRWGPSARRAAPPTPTEPAGTAARRLDEILAEVRKGKPGAGEKLAPRVERAGIETVPTKAPVRPGQVETAAEQPEGLRRLVVPALATGTALGGAGYIAGRHRQQSQQPTIRLASAPPEMFQPATPLERQARAAEMWAEMTGRSDGARERLREDDLRGQAAAALLFPKSAGAAIPVLVGGTLGAGYGAAGEYLRNRPLKSGQSESEVLAQNALENFYREQQARGEPPGRVSRLKEWKLQRNLESAQRSKAAPGTRALQSGALHGLVGGGLGLMAHRQIGPLLRSA